MKLIRTFHPVGHGAFYTECFYEKDRNIANVVYDCGGPGNMDDMIDRTFPSTDIGKPRIDMLFISHFHADHINGIRTLLDKCYVQRIIMPKLTDEAFLESMLYSCSNLGYDVFRAFQMLYDIMQLRDFGEGETKVIEVEIGEGYADNGESFNENPVGDINNPISTPTIIKLFDNWLYIPFSTVEKRCKLIEALRNSISELRAALSAPKIDFYDLAAQLTANHNLLERCKTVYAEVFNQRHNSYSMTLFSGICNKDTKCVGQCHKGCAGLPRYCTKNCMYMGDFEPNAQKNSNCRQCMDYYRNYWKKVGIFQVPHHGSRDNLNLTLYSPSKVAIISAGISDRYGHPHVEVIEKLQEYRCIPIIVTEKAASIQKFEYVLQ